MLHLIRDICRFLVTGRVPEQREGITVSFFLTFLILKFVVVIVFFILRFFVVDSIIEHKNQILFDKDYVRMFFNLVIFTPILEEFIYRYHLRFSERSVLISMAFSCFFFHDELLFLLVTLSYLIVLLILIKQRFNYNTLIFIYLSAAIFAFSHLIAYQDLLQSGNVFQVVFAISPHFVSGLLFSYVFLRSGILPSIFLHLTWNFIPYAVMLLKSFVLGFT